ncbi:MAG: CocE/NonD family hydrolase [Promethearchaeota archaeon]
MNNQIYSEKDHFKALEKVLKDKKYESYSVSSTYITMPDGVKIATDIALPEGLTSDDKIPSVLIQTRYWRTARYRVLFKNFIKPLGARNHIKAFTGFGYAVLSVDVRGTGASFGTRIGPWSEDEVKDDKDIIDWIIEQPWSDGKVVALGNSYSGTTAELVAVSNHPAVKGIVAMHNELDPFIDIIFPGGILNEWFINAWAHYVSILDRNKSKGLGILPWLIMKSVKPVEIDDGKNLLKKAVKDHLLNANIAEMTKDIIFRDEKKGEPGTTIKDFSVYRYLDKIIKSNIPLYYWGSWMDAATSNVVIESFLTFKNPFIGVIGAWTHGSKWKASPYLLSKMGVEPNYETQFQALAHFFNNCIKEQIQTERVIFYYTMGEERWKRTTNWPPDGHSLKRWYFHDKNLLTTEIPKEKLGVDDYKIDFTANTGKNNRWYTQLGGSLVIYKDRIEEDKKLLTYTSNPLKENIEITGYPIITLNMSSTHEDGAIFIYLEDIDENGNVYLITEGQFRLIHRKISSETPPYKILTPYHSFKEKDYLPLIPNEIAEITFGLLPTSVLIHKGHRIRIAIAGADKDIFARIPREGTPTITISRNKNYPSFIDIPVIKSR